MVEDSATQREALRHELEGAGYEVEIAATGEEGVARFDPERFHLVISDIVMPGSVDGYELCRRIKAGVAGRHVPVVLLTSLADPLDIINGLECGADNFLTKPYQAEHLLGRIDLLLATRQARAASRLQVGVDVFLLGRKFTISSAREQILDLLISTFEDAVLQNRALLQREEQLERSHQSLQGLYRIALGLNGASTEAEVAEVALERALELPGVQAGWISLRDGEDGFRLVAARGLPPAVAGPTAMQGDCFCRRKLLEGQFDSVVNVLTCERLQKAKGDTRGVRYHAAIPLWVGGRTIGIMNLAGPDDGMFSDDDLQILYGVGNQIAMAIERARLHEHLEGRVEERTAALRAEIGERQRAEARVGNYARQQAAVASLGSTALEGGELSALFDAAVALVAETLGVEYSKVLELLPGGAALLLRAGVGWKPGYVGTATVTAGKKSMAGYVLSSGGSVVSEDQKHETRFDAPALLLDHGVVSGVAVIIGELDHPFGVLGAHTTQRRTFAPDNVTFLMSVANILSTAVERQRAEQARARLATILEATSDLVGTAGPDGRLRYLNQAGRRMIGIGATEELTALTIPDLHPEREHPRLLTEILPSLLRDGVWNGETVFKARDGREIPVLISSLAHRPAPDAPLLLSVIARDLTSYKKLEQQFRQAQKLEAIGRLTGGIAHDFNNILTAISGYTELLLHDLAPGAAQCDDLEEIRKATDRATGLTRQLLAFSRQQVMKVRVLDLNAVVAGMDKMLRRIVGEDIDLTASLASDLGRVKADAGQLEQVILNLVVNARDAMPGGGKLMLETANAELDVAYVREHVAVTPGYYVMLAVSDTGTGMDAETKAKIFEPFFTTKATGKGTGLGLATVHGIVEQSGGNVWVYSEPDRGTTFKVYLPMVDEPATKPSVAPTSTRTLDGTETILVAEDNESVRRLVGTVLRARGYTVLEAAVPEAVLALAARHAGPIALLLTDVVMPGLSGPELAGRLQAARPELRVLYISGYTDDAIGRHGVLEPGVSFLEKPFTPTGLLRKVRSVLDD